MSLMQIRIKEKKYLSILWEDNSEYLIKLTNLRNSCPCAVCQEERAKQNPGYIPIYSDDQVTVQNIKVIGYYALNIVWKDGHSTGIYEYFRLREMDEKDNPLKRLIAG